MPKQQWPASVKVAWWEFNPGGSGYGTAKLPLEIGHNQVAVLLAIQAQVLNNSSSPTQGALWLYRRGEVEADDLPAAWYGYGGGWQHDKGVIDFTRGSLPANSSDAAYKVYPYPVILIRSPAVVYSIGGSQLKPSMGLWYVLQNVTDKELAELMVKDHA